MKTTLDFRKILFVLAALALALNATPALAAAPIEPPLFPGFNWDNLGAVEQAIDNGETVSVPGTLYRAQEKLENLEKAPESFFDFYSSPALAKSGWAEIQATGSESGVSTIYFNEMGYIALVRFAQCDDSSESLTCISAWVSEPTTLRLTPQPGLSATRAEDYTFSKKGPVDGSSNLKLPIAISWNKYTGPGLNRYRYCIDETDDDLCDESIGWTNAWSNTVIDVKKLKLGKTYYWQIQAVLNDNTKVDANEGVYWKFSTVSFKKLAPVSGARAQRLDVTLQWQASPFDDPEHFLYCISQSSVTCKDWVSTSSTSAQVKLNINTTYHWQVKAFDENGLSLDADSGTWWNFSTRKSMPRFDFNGDWKEDIAFYRPWNSGWNILGQKPLRFGKAGDIQVAADYNGDEKAEIAVFRPSAKKWYIKGRTAISFGRSGDIPVPADYNGDGKVDIAVFRPSNGTWYMRGMGSKAFGKPGDIPVPADYNGDGKADLAVFRPSENLWFIRGHSGSIPFGATGDILVPADYNGDGKTEIAIFRPGEGNWHVRGQSTPIAFGQNGDIPVPSDFNGDGKADYAIFRPSTGEWIIRG
ncbi:MAG: VCBS repeat-containing protein, partial [Chloroflexi bacterium]